MKELAILPEDRPNEVFVLVRVYNLLQERPKFKVYIDPGRLEGTLLRFETNQWTVKARA